MRMRSHTTWAYTITLLCVLAPALSFGQSLGEAAAAEGRRRAAHGATASSDKPAESATSKASGSRTEGTSEAKPSAPESAMARSSSTGTGKGAAYAIPHSSPFTGSAEDSGSARDAARDSKSTSRSDAAPPRAGRSASRGGSGTASGVAAPTAGRVFNNQALLETREQARSRGTFSQGSDDTSSSTTADSTSSPAGGSSPSAPSSPSSPGPVSSPRQSTSPTPAQPGPPPTPTPLSSGDGDAVRIPELARWKTQMVSYGQKACLQYANTALNDDERLGATYYDATRVNEQIADYTGNAVWDDCATKAKAIYRDYVMRNKGNVPGYWNFTTGFRMDWERKSDALSKQAAILLSQHASYCADTAPLDYTVGPTLSREVAYCILSYLDAEDLGAPRRARMTTLAGQALGHVDRWFISKSFRLPAGSDVPQATGQYYIQPFMVGLTMQALIRYWDVTHDPRVQPAVKTALDWLWARAWVAKDRAFWYQNWAPDESQAFPQKPGAPDLNLLIAPAFAWMYHQTGDVAYRDRGDQVFAGGVTGAWLDGPKQFNQNYMWSFDYVKWRSE